MLVVLLLRNSFVQHFKQTQHLNVKDWWNRPVSLLVSLCCLCPGRKNNSLRQEEKVNLYFSFTQMEKQSLQKTPYSVALHNTCFFLVKLLECFSSPLIYVCFFSCSEKWIPCKPFIQSRPLFKEQKIIQTSR